MSDSNYENPSFGPEPRPLSELVDEFIRHKKGEIAEEELTITPEERARMTRATDLVHEYEGQRAEVDGLWEQYDEEGDETLGRAIREAEDALSQIRHELDTFGDDAPE